MKHAAALILAAALSATPLFAQAQSDTQGPPMRDGRGGPGGPGGQDMPGSRVMGTITAVTPDTLTVRTMDGEELHVKAGPNTRVTHEREPAKLADLKPGDGIMAFGQPDNSDAKTVRAVFIAYESAAEVKERSATFGKTWIAGKVTAINGASLTLDVRAPGEAEGGKSQTITADENTSFKRGRESITMADIHAGDMVMGQGQVKAGVFVPATLQVRNPGERRQRPGAGGPPAPTPPQQ